MFGGSLLFSISIRKVNILALDLSLTSTGYSHNGETGIISCNGTGPYRLSYVKNEVEKLINQHSIDIVVLEGYSFSSRNSQAHSIGELGGVIRLLLGEREIGFIVMPPTCRANFATGKGHASKNEVISSISAKTGMVWQNPGADDKCDAWVMEEMVLYKVGKARFDWPSTHVSALDKVDWSVLDIYKAAYGDL